MVLMHLKVAAYESRKLVVHYVCISLHALCSPVLHQWYIPKDLLLTHSLKLVSVNF